MDCAGNTCKNETAVKHDTVNFTYNFTQTVNVCELYIILISIFVMLFLCIKANYAFKGHDAQKVYVSL